MKLSDIYAALGRKEILSGDAAIASRAAIEVFAKMTGLPIFMLDYRPPALAKALASSPEIRSSVPSFAAWRRTLLDLQMRVAPGNIDGDSWASLRRALRLDGMDKIANALRGLELSLPDQTRPQDITIELLIDLKQRKVGTSNRSLTTGIAALINASQSSTARAAGLLPAETIPVFLSGRTHATSAPMSPEIKAYHARQTSTGAISIAYVNRLAFLAGLLNGKTDTVQTLIDVSQKLPSPKAVGLKANRNLPEYVAGICRTGRRMGYRDPRLSDAANAWHDLILAVTKLDLETNHLSALRRMAEKQGCAPHEMSPALAKQMLADTSKKRAFLLGCEQFDALFGVIPAAYLPLEPTSLRIPQKSKPNMSKALPDPISLAWSAFYREIKKHEGTRKDINDLSFLRSRAEKDGLYPQDLSQNWIGNIELRLGSSDRTRLNAAIRTMNIWGYVIGRSSKKLRELPGRRILGSSLPERIAEDCTILSKDFGLAPSTERALRASLGSLYVMLHAQDRKFRGLDDLLTASYPTSSIKPEHEMIIASLRDDLALGWTKDWWALQRAVSAAGIPRSKSPVFRVLQHAGREQLEPWQLTRRWAQRVDRSLRSTIHNPPHGRADLAQTFTKHLNVLDDLRKNSEFSRKDLLPSPIGPVR